MRLLISPAKKMREEDFLAPAGEPLFLHRAGRLLEALRAMSYPELKKLLACNDAIAQVNYQRYQAMDLARAFTPALLAYEGIQYQYMAPGLFTQPQFDYVKEHLRILSGFYGLLRPLDPVTPYRLEMQAKLAIDGCKNLYQFWGDALARRWSRRRTWWSIWPPRSTPKRCGPIWGRGPGSSPACSPKRQGTGWWKKVCM